MCLGFVLVALLAPPGFGAQQEPNPAETNPIYNTVSAGNKYAWIIKGDHEEEPKLKRQAVALILKGVDEGGGVLSDRRFTGTLETYEIRGSGNQRKYKRSREDVDLIGVSNTPPPNVKSRKRIKFRAIGTYVESQKGHVVMLIGFYQPGNDGSSQTRSDDRLVVRMIDKPVDELLGWNAWRATIMFTAENPPCDDTPDDDILEEAPYDPVADPLEDSPVLPP
jgi:hypothetical protein